VSRFDPLTWHVVFACADDSADLLRVFPRCGVVRFNVRFSVTNQLIVELAECRKAETKQRSLD
jgi:hypothetical protein